MDRECNFKLVATFKFGKTPNIDKSFPRKVQFPPPKLQLAALP